MKLRFFLYKEDVCFCINENIFSIKNIEITRNSYAYCALQPVQKNPEHICCRSLMEGIRYLLQRVVLTISLFC